MSDSNIDLDEITPDVPKAPYAGNVNTDLITPHLADYKTGRWHGFFWGIGVSAATLFIFRRWF